MPRVVKVDAKKLFEEYKKGSTVKELKERFGLKTPAQIHRAIIEAQIQLGVLPPLKSSRRTTRKNMDLKAKVGKRGNLNLSPNTVKILGLSAGDRFVVRKRGESIILRKV